LEFSETQKIIKNDTQCDLLHYLSEYSIDTLVDSLLESGSLKRDKVRVKRDALKFIPEIEKVYGPHKDIFEANIEVKKARIGLSAREGI
jgi:hypothetical protein